MVDWVGYRAALRNAVVAALPEVQNADGGGIWTRPGIERVALEDVVTDLPAAVATTVIIQTAPPLVATELVGIANHVWDVEHMFHYVRRRPNSAEDMEEYVEGRLAALQQQLLHVELAVGQVIDVTGIDVSEGNLINAVLLDKNKAYYGGTLTVMCQVGDSPA